MVGRGIDEVGVDEVRKGESEWGMGRGGKRRR